MSASVSAWLMAIDSWPTVAQWAFKGCFALTLGAGVAAALSALRASADVRHRAWAAALVAALLLPGFAAALPTWSPDWGAAASPEVAAAPAVVAFVPTETTTNAPSAEPAASVTRAVGATASEAPATSTAIATAPSSFSWLRLLAVVWLLGAVLSLAPVAAGLISLARLGRRARHNASPRLNAALARAQRDLGMQRPIRLWMSGERSMPMTWGWLRPVVLLPADAELWTDARLHAVLAHELAHVERRDPLVRLVAQLARAAYWFYPLAHLALRQLEREQEFACDDRALGAGQRPAEYAEHLLAVASALSTIRFAPSAALAMAQPGRLERRLQAVLDPRAKRQPMSRRTRRISLAAGLVACSALACVQARAVADADQPDDKTPPDATAGLGFDELRARVLDRYITRPDERKLLAGALEGMLEALNDPYTAYVPSESWSDLLSHIEGKLSGIGAELKNEEGQVVVSRALPGSAAERAGLVSGDRILSVDGKAVTGEDLPAVARKIRGPVGSEVLLRIARVGSPEQELRIRRAPITLARMAVSGYRLAGPPNRWQHWLDGEQKLAYIRLDELTAGSAAEVERVMDSLQQEGLKGLVLDLRSSPGGMAEQALAIARLFAQKGALLTTFHGRGDKVTRSEAEQAGKWRELPLVVLVNQSTSSAAELLAGALAARSETVLVGTRTFGKGTVQELVPLGEGLGGVRLTTGFYRLPSGRAVQRQPGNAEWGVDPTEGDYVPLSAEQLAALSLRLMQQPEPQSGSPPSREEIERDDVDLQLAAALRALSGRVRDGKFASVGQPLPTAEPLAAQRREELDGRRKRLLQQLKQLNEELGQLEAN